jgi:hypothetical protein
MVREFAVRLAPFRESLVASQKVKQRLGLADLADSLSSSRVCLCKRSIALVAEPSSSHACRRPAIRECGRQHHRNPNPAKHTLPLRNHLDETAVTPSVGLRELIRPSQRASTANSSMLPNIEGCSGSVIAQKSLVLFA